MPDISVKKLRDLLLVTVPEHLLDSEMITLRREVSQASRMYASRWVLLDFSAVEICDSFFGRFVQMMAETARLQGSQVIVTGLQDSVVETMVELGFDLGNIKVTLDVDDALDFTTATEAAERAGGRDGALAQTPSSVQIDEWDDDLTDIARS